MPNTKFIDIGSSEYPTLLRDIQNPPKKLYYKGFWNPALFNKCLSVVGSRKMTMYGRQVINKLLTELSGFDLTVVSGFMYGVDIASHEKAIVLNIPTIAVLPFGINYLCDEPLHKLYSTIYEKNGLLISEWPDELEPRKWTFYKRNRIVAGLSKATLVVEAGINSGSLITAGFAKKYNRDVLVVPGSIFNEMSSGILHLLNDGAKAVYSGFQIWDLLKFDTIKYSNIDNIKFIPPNKTADALSLSILDIIKTHPSTIDELCLTLNKQVDILSTNITLLILSGDLLEEHGRYYLPCL